MRSVAGIAWAGLFSMLLVACSASDNGSPVEDSTGGGGASTTGPGAGGDSVSTTGGTTSMGGTSSAAAGSTNADASASGDATSRDSAIPIDALIAADAPVHVVRSCSGLAGAGVGQWENITPLPNGIVPMSSTIDATGTLWVGAYARSSTFPSSGGIFKSTDCGASWVHVNTGVNGPEIDRSAIWSMAIDLDAGAEPVLYVIGMTGPNGLLKSTNGGVDWVQRFPAGDMVSHIVPAGPGNPPIASIAS